jgi:succinyl-diaminopimelate desuccinylase
MPPARADSSLADRALALVDLPSVSGSEAAVRDYVREAVPLPLAYDDGETLLYARRIGKPLVLLAGHLDTVPAQGNLPGRIEGGAIVGLGASDMKGGLAVMIELGRLAAESELAYDLALLFFPREELGPAHDPLPHVFERAPLVREAALVVCLEPTDNTLQLGCLGNLTARAVFEGRSAHSARPWLGVNAVALALDGLRPVLELEPCDVEVEGLVFREVLSVVQLHAGVAANVIPARAEAVLNFRYAPDRSPLVERLRRAGPFEVGPKQAWTNVADFAAVGLDAVNLGPGATRYAHAADERVEVAELERTYDALRRFLAGSV